MNGAPKSAVVQLGAWLHLVILRGRVSVKRALWRVIRASINPTRIGRLLDVAIRWAPLSDHRRMLVDTVREFEQNRMEKKRRKGKGGFPQDWPSARATAIRFSFDALKFLSRVPGMRLFVFFAIGVTPIDGELKEKTIANIFGDNIPLAQFWNFDGLTALGKADSALRGTRLRRLTMTNEAIGSLVDHSTIHLLLETGAPLPQWLDEPKLVGVSFRIYAFDERVDEIAARKLTTRCHIVSLRELFPDIAPESEALHLFARRLACKAVRTHFEHVSLSTLSLPFWRSDVLALGLEDDIAWRLSLLECYRAALRLVEDDHAAVFVAKSHEMVPNGLDLLRGVVDDDRFFISHRQFSLWSGERFWSNIQKASVGGGSKDAPRNQVDEPHSISSGTSISRAIKHAIHLGHSQFSDWTERPENSSFEVLIHAPVSKPYVETVSALTNRTAQSSVDMLSVNCVLAPLSESKNTAQPDAADVECASLEKLAILLVPTFAGSQRDAVEQALAGALASDLIYDGVQLGRFFIPRIATFLSGRLLASIAAYAVGRELGSNKAVRSAITCPGRHWLVRAVAAGFADGSAGAPIIDVQALNVLDHSKYFAPIADRITAIDTTARDLYQSALGVPSDRISITGTPRNDALRDAVAGLDREEIAAKLGLDPDCKKRILLASQLQPFSRLGQIADALAEILTVDPEVELVVKMHPREGEGRAVAYREVLQRPGIVGRVSINHEISPHEVIAASDVCVTIYSNMAREAAVTGRDVVVALFTGWEPPIRFDREGIATGAHSRDDFIAAVRESLRPGGDGQASNPYFAANPHLKKGDAVQAIRDVIEDAVDVREAERAVIHKRLGAAKSISVALEDGRDLDSLIQLLPHGTPTRIFVNKPPKKVLPDHISLQTGRYNTETRTSIEAATARAEKTARAVVERLTTLFSGTSLEKDVQAIAEPLWLRARAPLIATEREATNLLHALDDPADVIVLAARDPAVLAAWTAAAKPDVEARIMTVPIGANAAVLPRELPLGIDLQGLHIEAPEAASPIENVFTTDNQDELNNWRDALASTTFEMPHKPAVLLTTAWHLKTVPGTLEPILSRLSGTASVTAFNLGTGKLDDLATCLLETTGGTVIMPADLSRTIPESPKSSARALEAALQTSMMPITDGLPSVHSARRKIATDLVRTMLWETLGWRAYCRRVFETGRTVSVGCPGRQWHTEVAHSVARDAGCDAITIQNAYMSEGYTYTRPTGNVVTAIDTWSRDLFVSHYGVESQDILVSSTPRFDYLADLANLDRASALRELGVPSGTSVVLFAAQEGFDVEARDITRALTRIQPRTGAVRVYVKTHPRSPRSLVEELRDNFAGEDLSSSDGVALSLIVTDELSTPTLLAASDIVVTIYSNVGIEAAALDKTLVIAKFGDDELPLPLDRFGIGRVARSPDDLTATVSTLLNDPAERVALSQDRQTYLDANPLLRSGGSADLLASRIRDGLSISSKG